MNERELLQRALRRAARLGYEAELYAQRLHSHRIVVHDDEVESSSASQGYGVGLRLERDGRVGSSYTTELASDAIDAMVDRAAAAAGVAEAREVMSLAAVPTDDYPVLSVFDERLLELQDERRVELARSGEQSARERDPRVAKSEGATWRDVHESVSILSSLGVDVQGQHAHASLSVDIVAVDNGDERTGYHQAYGRHADAIDAAEVGRRAADKAVGLLGSRQVGTARVPVLMTPEVGAALLELLCESLSAQACLLGTSMLAGKRDTAIAASCVTLVDDPFHPDGIGGSAFDDEGVPARKLSLIEGGSLRGYLHNSYTARRMGADLTANALRDGFKSVPGIGSSNLILQPGARSGHELLQSMERGFVVQDVMGLHMANTVSGDFSLGIVGHLVEKGEIVCPVDEMTIAGNLLDLLTRIAELGSDLQFVGDIASPSLLVDGLTVSGR